MGGTFEVHVPAVADRVVVVVAAVRVPGACSSPLFSRLLSGNFCMQRRASGPAAACRPALLHPSRYCEAASGSHASSSSLSASVPSLQYMWGLGRFSAPKACCPSSASSSSAILRPSAQNQPQSPSKDLGTKPLCAMKPPKNIIHRTTPSRSPSPPPSPDQAGKLAKPTTPIPSHPIPPPHHHHQTLQARPAPSDPFPPAPPGSPPARDASRSRARSRDQWARPRPSARHSRVERRGGGGLRKSASRVRACVAAHPMCSRRRAGRGGSGVEGGSPSLPSRRGLFLLSVLWCACPGPVFRAAVVLLLLHHHGTALSPLQGPGVTSRLYAPPVPPEGLLVVTTDSLYSLSHTRRERDVRSLLGILAVGETAAAGRRRIGLCVRERRAGRDGTGIEMVARSMRG